MAAAALTDLVGRDEELRQLEMFLNEAAHGPPAIVLVGEAGIGKTALWWAAVEWARGRGFRVLEARPTEAERELSFAALGDLLGDVHDEIGGLPAPQRRALRVALLLEEPSGTPPDERAVATALSSLLASLAEERVVIVAIDDVQWLDESTRSALRFALRRAQAVALLARRPGADGAELADAEVLDVLPLRLEALDDLLQRHLRASFLRPTLLEIERVSGGNPLFALELARALVALRKPPRPSEPLPVPEYRQSRSAVYGAFAHAGRLHAAVVTRRQMSASLKDSLETVRTARLRPASSPPVGDAQWESTSRHGIAASSSRW